MVGAGAFVEPRDIGKRGDPRIVAARHDLQPLGDQRPVHPGQRHHVAYRPESHEIEPGHQVRFRVSLAVPVCVPERPVDRDREQEGDADGGELAAVVLLVQAVRVDHRHGLRERRLRDVVVEHHDIEPQGGGLGERFVRRRSAIHGYDDGDSVRLKRAHPADIGSVSLGHPVGHIDRELVSDGREKASQERRRGRSVDVVVREDPDPFAVMDRAYDPLAGAVHVAQRGRVGERRAQRGVEEVVDPIDPDAPSGKNAGDNLRQSVRLGDGERLPVVSRPWVPALSGDRPGDIQIVGAGRGRRDHRVPARRRSMPSNRRRIRGWSCAPDCGGPPQAAPSPSWSA